MFIEKKFFFGLVSQNYPVQGIEDMKFLVLLFSKYNEHKISYLNENKCRAVIAAMELLFPLANALLKMYSSIVRKIDLDSSSWVKSIFLLMGYVQRKNTSSKVDIPNEAIRKSKERCVQWKNTSSKVDIPDEAIRKSNINFTTILSPKMISVISLNLWKWISIQFIFI